MRTVPKVVDHRSAAMGHPAKRDLAGQEATTTSLIPRQNNRKQTAQSGRLLLKLLCSGLPLCKGNMSMSVDSMMKGPGSQPQPSFNDVYRSTNHTVQPIQAFEKAEPP